MTALERLLTQVLAAIVLAIIIGIGVRAYGAHQYQAGVYAGAQAAAKAVIKRTQENEALAARQSETNTTITKEKDDEISDLRRRLAATPRLRVGPSICPDRPAAPAQAESSTGSDSADPSAGLVSSRADADFKQLIEEVEQDLVTGRACQAFIEKNGLVP